MVWKVRIGERRHVIDIQEATETRDDFGAITQTWATVEGLDNIRAAIWPISAREVLNKRQLELEITHRVNIYYFPDVTAKQRIKWGDRYFDIDSVINPG